MAEPSEGAKHHGLHRRGAGGGGGAISLDVSFSACDHVVDMVVQDSTKRHIMSACWFVPHCMDAPEAEFVAVKGGVQAILYHTPFVTCYSIRLCVCGEGARRN